MISPGRFHASDPSSLNQGCFSPLHGWLPFSCFYPTSEQGYPSQVALDGAAKEEGDGPTNGRFDSVRQPETAGGSGGGSGLTGKHSSVSCRAKGWQFDSPLGLLGVESACVALGKLHHPRVPPEEGNGQPLLSTLYLKNSEKGCHKSELT